MPHISYNMSAVMHVQMWIMHCKWAPIQTTLHFYTLKQFHFFFVSVTWVKFFLKRRGGGNLAGQWTEMEYRKGRLMKNLPRFTCNHRRTSFYSWIFKLNFYDLITLIIFFISEKTWIWEMRGLFPHKFWRRMRWWNRIELVHNRQTNVQI